MRTRKNGDQDAPDDAAPASARPPLTTNAYSGARRTTALIVEGGAMRGAWAAGVLAFLYEQGRQQFDLVYAASSGACSAAYFVAGMYEPGLRIWREHACRVVRKSNLLRRKPIIDVAYMVDHIFRQHVPLSVEALQKAPTRFFIVLTDCHTGEPVYFHACDDRVFAALRATSTMPLTTRGFDYVDGQPFADGGVSDPIPIQRALQDGATDITVVITHNYHFRLKPMPRWLGRLAYPEFPRVARAWTPGQSGNTTPPSISCSSPRRASNSRCFGQSGRCRSAPSPSRRNASRPPWPWDTTRRSHSSQPPAPAWTCHHRRGPFPSRFPCAAGWPSGGAGGVEEGGRGELPRPSQAITPARMLSRPPEIPPATAIPAFRSSLCLCF